MGASRTTGGRQGQREDRQGVVFSVPGVLEPEDLHGNPCGAGLVLFIGGNQFMVVPGLIRAFVRAQPSLQVFCETLPPGILAEQMQCGNTLTLGHLTINVAPDVYAGGREQVEALTSAGLIQAGTRRTYARNTLAVLVAAGNPRGIASLADLARDDLRLWLPNPGFEGIGRLMEQAFHKAGGDALVAHVMEEKRRLGRTVLTRMHHRETPRAIVAGQADAGVVWRSEALFHAARGLAMVAIERAHNVQGEYVAGLTAAAPHPAAGLDWLEFLAGDTAGGIYASCGFERACAGPW